MVKEIHSLAEFDKEIQGPGLVVVDFFTTWCGPCKAIAPFIEGLATKYPEVKFIKVDIEKNEDIAAPRRISSIPTFHFYANGQLKDEMKGANPQALEQKVQQHKVSTNRFGGAGNKLSSESSAGSLDPREARLRQFASMEAAKKQEASLPSPAPASDPTPSASKSDEEEALAQAMALSLAETAKPAQPSAASRASAQDAADQAAAEQELAQLEANPSPPEIHTAPPAGGDWEEEMVPVPVNEEHLRELLDMGFSEVRGRKALVHGGSVEGALGWLDEHQDDPDIDQPYMVRKADTIPKPPMSEEEKARKIEEVKLKIKQRREERAKQEKAEEIRREKERRERGQKMEETLEERQKMMRKREAEKLKKEKEDAAKERARLKAEIARDKEIRKMNKGVIPSVLGVDGYNPSSVQYDQPQSAPAVSSATPAPAPVTISALPAAPVPPVVVKKVTSPVDNAPITNPEEKIEQAIGTIARYRTGGDGGQALKLLLTFIKNIVEQPEENKYRSINMESAAFKSKLSPLVGPMLLLKAVGFVKDEEENKLKYEGDGRSPLLTGTMQKLTQAEALYRQMNPV